MCARVRAVASRLGFFGLGKSDSWRFRDAVLPDFLDFLLVPSYYVDYLIPVMGDGR